MTGSSPEADFRVLCYPMATRASQADDYHGEKVFDPYRGLEEIGDPQTAAWVAAQNELTETILATVPAREAIRSRLAGLWSYPRLGIPFERGGRWFQTRSNPDTQNQPVLYVADAPGDAGDTVDAGDTGHPGRVLLDPNALCADGTTSVSAICVSPDGSKVAYATSRSGSDWLTWQVREVASGTDLGDAVEWSKSSIAGWRQDGSGFYYAAMKPPRPGREYQDLSDAEQVYFHRAGTPQRDDELVFAPDDAAVVPRPAVSADGRYLILSLRRGIDPGAELRVLDLQHADAGFRVLMPASGAQAAVVASQGATFYLRTDDAADSGRIVAIDLAHPGRPHWREVVPASADTLLEAHFFGGHLVCHYLRDACSLLKVFGLDGAFVRDIPLPDLTTLAGSPVEHERIAGSPESDIVHYGLESFTESESLWAHDLAAGTTTLVRAATVALDPGDFVTERVRVTSADGTALPMFVTRRRDLPRSGDVPVLLCGYGGVGVPVTPAFSAQSAVWLERGGMLAAASLRGGGEFGRGWHEAGRRGSKQNVFDDFCACARWLASSGWSRAGRIAINGGSNGGLLVGACLTQQPGLFGAAVADAGVFDMLRFHRFTVGWSWRDEYGDPEDPGEYRWLRRYSPLHNVRPGRYPPTLLTTGDHDDRVVPGHSLKFAAALQAAQRASAPVLLRVTAAAGHGGGKPAAQAIAEAADRLAFLEAALRLAGRPGGPGRPAQPGAPAFAT